MDHGWSQALVTYAISAVIAMATAGVIKLIVVILGNIPKKKAD